MPPPADAGPPDTGPVDAGPPTTIGGDRPARVIVPSSYDASTPMPLMLLLHGYGATGVLQDVYFNMSAEARRVGFLLVEPDGEVDSMGNHFWNATDACCDYDHTGVDDSSYLEGLIGEMKADYNVDPKRVFIVGHSNGAFMAYRMACDHADDVVAIAGLAGATWADDSKCNPTKPVSVLHIHGTADSYVPYDTAAPTSTMLWAAHDGCDTTMTTMGDPIDLVTNLPGAETNVARYDVGCQANSEVDLWTIQDGTHVPALQGDFTDRVWTWLSAHARP